ncbi:hypothetical protein ACFL2J_05540 [Candidatus Omnitrophota bacterium]
MEIRNDSIRRTAYVIYLENKRKGIIRTPEADWQDAIKRLNESPSIQRIKTQEA